MKKEESIYLSVALIIVLIIIAVVLVNFKSVGMVVLDDYTNQSSCENANYTWELNQTCTTETIGVNAIGSINLLEYNLPSSGNASNFIIITAWDITNESSPILIPETNYSLDSETGIVINATAVIYPDVNFTYTYDNSTCIITGGQCVADICGDGVIQSPNDDGINEACDDGDNNGVACTANYGNSCEWCSSDCQTLTSVQGSFCGDGICDSEEDCDSCDDCGCASGYTCNSGACEEDSSSSGESDEDSSESSISVPVPKLSTENIPALSLNPGDSQKIKWKVTNAGGITLNSCILKPLGDFSSWITFSEETKNLEAGEEGEFIFDVIVPAEAEEGEYGLSVSVICSEKTVVRDFNVNVEKKKLELNITNAEKTRGDKIKVYYSLKELSGTDQDVSLQFSILTLNDKEIANIGENRSIKANSTRNFRTTIPVNESVEGELSLLANFNSQIYSSSVQESLVSGALVGGFAVSEGMGTGSVVILIIVVAALAAIFFVVRNKRRNLKSSGK